MYADDVIIFSSEISTYELECKLQSCDDRNSLWYNMNKLCINEKQSSVMAIGSRYQLQSFDIFHRQYAFVMMAVFLP